MRECPPSLKCVVWDLDNTVWDGVLGEDGVVRLRPEIAGVIRTLDAHGVLHSVASRSDAATARAELLKCGLDDYFLYPQINWGAKAASIATIAQSLNIALDAIAFVDDDPFEREAVRSAHPDVRCLDARAIRSVADMPVALDDVPTREAATRRQLYRADQHRQSAEANFVGDSAEFLAGLNLVLTTRLASPGDLDRAEELTQRTHQLNSTGLPYSRDELEALRQSRQNCVLISTLEDRFGFYGQIGLVLLETLADVWTIKLLLTSCRVASRGVGGVLLLILIGAARKQNVRLQAEFRATDRNRIMYVTLKLAGFRESGRRGDVLVLEHSLPTAPAVPAYVRLRGWPQVSE